MLGTAVRSGVGSTLSLSGGRGPRTVAVMHVGNRCLDREEGEAERDERGRKSVNQRHVHGRYLNLMRRPFKGTMFCAAKPHPGAARLSAAKLRAVGLYVRWLAGGLHSLASGTGR